ncbi:MAG: DUF2007 domain-containing protein [bacterium]
MMLRSISDPDKEHWESAFSTSQLYQAEMLKDLLEAEEIPAIVINKQDSSYLSFGDIEVHVKRDDILKAKIIVNRFQSNE